jgi:dTDP-4-dehydrorhamnose reductase
MPVLLVVGANGQLGLELQRAPLPRGWVLRAAGRDELDLAQPGAVREAIATLRPDAVINAAAYTAVDKAQTESELAFAINRDGAASLAEAAAKLDAPLVQVSTDYVFSGDKPAPYVETDPKAPLGVYGRSKSEGEDAVLGAHPRAAVLRTSWVYSPHRANFVKTMLRLGATRGEVRVVADQVGRPTAARDLAAACVAVTERLLAEDQATAGVFHYAGAGDASWADFAEAIFEEAAKHGRAPVRVARITTADYPTPARRPANSRLDTTRIETSLGIRPRPWRDALRECVAELLAR